MTASLHLFSVAGIRVRMHWTFLLLVAFIFVSALMDDAGVVGAARAVVFVLAIFVCIVLHEFGHAFAARQFGIRTRDVTLLPIGGLARLERMPERPGQEFVVAIAGPLVNVIIVLALLPVVFAVHGAAGAAMPEQPGLHDIDFLTGIVMVNIFIVAFNMLPAFPMDGGRVLRAVLSVFMDRVRATSIAAAAGQTVAVLFLLIGLLTGHVLLVLVAVFVFLGAGAEAQHVRTSSVLRGVRVRDAMVRRFRVLHESDALQVAVDELIAGEQHDFPVLADGAEQSDADAIRGLLTRRALIAALAESGPNARVGDVMSPSCREVSPDAPIERAIEIARTQEQADGTRSEDDRLFSARTCPVVPVVERATGTPGRIVGMITPENISETIAVRQALAGR